MSTRKKGNKPDPSGEDTLPADINDKVVKGSESCDDKHLWVYFRMVSIV
jgi:hypothetical protein